MPQPALQSLPQPISRIRQDIQGMHAYAIQDASGMVKLDAMENPHRLSAALQAELGARLGAVALNRYPGVDVLKATLMAQVPTGCSLMLGNGSDELISLLAMAVAQPGTAATILAPVPGFVMYAMSAQFQSLAFVGVPLLANFELDRPAMCQAIEQHSPAVTYLACPNNPTANLWARADVVAVVAACERVGGLCVLDEAYQPFASHSYSDLVTSNSHVLVMRTLSKFGLAGVRLGYLFGPSTVVSAIDKLRPPYNISALNAECALFALAHQSVYAAQAAQICADREVLMAGLRSLPGIEVFDSQANMVLVRVNDADACFAALKSKGILVKNVSRMHPLLANCLRLTVGTTAENEALLRALAT